MLCDILHCVYATGNQIALIFTSNRILCKIYLKSSPGQAGTKNDNIVKTIIDAPMGKILDNSKNFVGVRPCRFTSTNI
jgi:hypothetical protein